ncbi:MAG TPA: SIMPL domain-containing protein [Polyangiaceae bacterium]|nr:SIMPL domain-containing protein [Polyangiaceae bacterium]
MRPSTDTEPAAGTLAISAVHEREVNADAADLHVTVQGLSLVTGGAALKKAKEVAALVTALVQAGITESDIQLESVQLESSSGLLGRSSAARYRLRVRCNELEHLPDALGAVTAAKNARLDALDWRYPESREQYAEWLERALDEANFKARVAAAALGARITGIHHASERSLDDPESPRRRTFALEGVARAARAAPVDLGFELSHRRKVGVRVDVQYRIEGFEPPAAMG